MDTPNIEVWKRVRQRPQYEVSNLGRLRGPCGLRTKRPSKDGYVRVNLGPRPQWTATMHSLVAEAFLGPRPRGWCVNHKNGVRDDNRIANLQWTTYSANNMATRRIRCPLMRKQAGNGKRRIDEVQRNKHARGEAHGMAKLTNEQVLAVHSLSAVGWLNKEISAELGIRCLSVNDILAGRTWRHLHPDPQKRL